MSRRPHRPRAADAPTRAARLALGALVACAACTHPGGRTPDEPLGPPAPAGWTLAWADEFDGALGAPPDPAAWAPDTGGGGWGNQEREYYTTGTANAALDGDGHLVLTARAEPAGGATPTRACWYGPCRYTSARLTTRGRVTAAYGRVEARLRLPGGQGLWPAFWMLGDDIDRVGWPRCGEIDIMEQIGREPAVVHGTVHGPGYSGAASIGGPDTLAQGSYQGEFHVFAVEWEPGEVRWLVDGRTYRRTTPADLPPGGAWAFDHPFFLLLNVAVGGAWPGDPDASTTFPQTMAVDYVRVYRRAGGAAQAPARRAPGA